MAEILPLRAWRYTSSLTGRIEELTSPLFDVVSEKQRQRLYQEPFNSIHLSVPKGARPAWDAKKRLEEWKRDGIVVQDPLPSIYVYYQEFSLPGSQKVFRRKGFICNIRAYDWEEKILLRHENTIPKAVNDRIEILDKTQLNVSPTHGLYTDPSFTLEKYMDEAMHSPIYDNEDYQGVRDIMAVIQDREVIKLFIELLKEKQIILADGHHRYEGSLLYRRKMMGRNPKHSGHEGYNYHMMFMTNTESDDLRILPTHRVVSGLPGFNKADIMKLLEDDFIIKPIEEAHMLPDIMAGKEYAFGIVFQDEAWKLRLKPDRWENIPWKFPDLVKRLDLTVLHYYIIEKILKIPGKDQRSSEYIHFDRSFSDVLAQAVRGDIQMGIITNEISMEEVKEVCYSGFTMPQKSTYFYPKVICGYLFSSIKDGEFQESIDPCL